MCLSHYQVFKQIKVTSATFTFVFKEYSKSMGPENDTNRLGKWCTFINKSEKTIIITMKSLIVLYLWHIWSYIQEEKNVRFIYLLKCCFCRTYFFFNINASKLSFVVIFLSSFAPEPGTEYISCVVKLSFEFLSSKHVVETRNILLLLYLAKYLRMLLFSCTSTSYLFELLNLLDLRVYIFK